MMLTVELMVALGTGVLTLLGFWWGLARWIMAEFRQRDLALQAECARAKVAEDDLRRALEAHKLYAAENFATAHELKGELGEVRKSIDKLTERLDKILMIGGVTLGERGIG